MAIIKKIVVSGSPVERGESYGSQCKDMIHAVIENYKKLFSSSDVTVSWKVAREKANELLPEIEALGPELAEEMRGIAKGAEMDFEDILTLNCRSEILSLIPERDEVDECSVCAILPERSQNGNLIVAQNWDMYHWVGENSIILEILNEAGPDAMIITEAGQLARYGINQNGIVLSISSLPGTKNNKLYGTPSVPLRRKYLMEEHWVEGYDHIFECVHMMPMHYLLGCGDGMGEAFSIEAHPEGKYLIYSENGLLYHSNHPLRIGADPLPNAKRGSSIFRCDILRHQLQMKEKHTYKDLYMYLNNPFGSPFCICAQRNSKLDDIEQIATLACFIMDATDKRLWIRKGNNMNEPLEEYFWTRPEKLKK